MNDFVFENQGTNTYLVYEISPEDSIDSMSLGMITNNKISGLASTLFTQMDATKYIKYNVSAKISVSQFFSGAVNKKRMLGVFRGIVNALLSAEDYMINEDTIILDLDYIFADVSTCETVLICLPVQGAAKHHDLGAFFKGIMFSTQFDQTENCDYVARIINYLNSTPMFSLTDFKALLDSIESSNVASSQPTQKVQAATPSPSQTSTQPKVEQTAPTQTTPAVHTQPKIENTAPKQTTTVNIPSGGNIVQPQVKPATPPAEPQQTETPEKKISMFGLLMHYSKENAELYKAQKAAKKVAPAQAPAAAQPQKKVPQTSYAVPGNSNPGFAIPGQTAQPPVTPAAVQPPQPQQTTVNSTPKTQVQTVQQPAFVPQRVPQGQAANFGETTVLGGGAVGETTVLGAAASPVKADPHLIRAKNNEKIPLNKPVFRIGKERSYVDYFISDNTAISRGHANIVNHNGELFVVDTNSTNHTYVNGVMIQSGVETKLAHGDKVRLANEDFEFRMY